MSKAIEPRHGIDPGRLVGAIEKATHVGHVAVDLEAIQTYVSPAFCHMVGFTAEELVGAKAPFVYWPPEELVAIQSAFDKRLDSDRAPEPKDLRFARKDGVRIDVNLSIAPIYDEHDEVSGWLASVLDVTAQKRAEFQLAEAQRLSHIGDWRWNLESGEIFWSGELYRQYGQDPQNFRPTYQSFLDQVAADDRVLAQETIQRALESDSDYTLEVRIRRPDGEVCWQHIRGTIVRDHSGTAVQLFGTCQDVTEQKRLELERLDDVIHRVVVSFSEELDEQRLIQRITDEARSLCQADFGALFTNAISQEGNSFMLFTLSGASSEDFANFPLPRATPLFGPTFEGAEIIRSDDVRKDPRYGLWGPQPKGHLPVVSYLAVPVISRTGEVLGGLFFAHHLPGQFLLRHERIMVALAAHAAIALDNSRFHAVMRASEESANAARLEAEHAAALLADQRNILELIATDRPLHETLDCLIAAIESHSDEAIKGSILLLDAKQGKLHHGAAPGLPDAYNEAIHGVSIGPSVASCGTAAYEDREVLVTDIANDPLWADYKERALAHGLRACWSTPIRSSNDKVLGTFAVYGDRPREPSAEERQLLGTLNRIAAIAIERKRVDEELHDANRRKDEFLALLGHELRNPLAPILTALELMEIRGVGAEKERAAIDRNVRHMVQLVDDLLDVSRIVQGKIAIERTPLDLERVLGDAAEIALPLIEERGHHLRIEAASGVFVDGDAIRLAQVFSNLLTNAAKYTDPGGHLSIKVTKEVEHVKVMVADTGTGIAPELLPHIFEPFIQGKRDSDRAKGGLGLGLPLVRSLVGLHGGEVSATSAGNGKGTEVCVRLPLCQEARQLSEPIPQAAPLASDKTVLVVDDNKDAALMMGEYLGALGYQVVVAHDGPEALRLLDGHDFQLGILDIGLPVMDGYELCRRILERKPIRLIALTGYGRPSDRQKSAAAGFSAHLVKPVRTPELLRALDPTSDISAS